MSRGVLFFALPDGTFVFGKPESKAKPEFQFIDRKSDPRENNVLEGVLDENISKRYSQVRVMGQPQGTDLDGMPIVNSPLVILDDLSGTFPPACTSPS